MKKLLSLLLALTLIFACTIPFAFAEEDWRIRVPLENSARRLDNADIPKDVEPCPEEYATVKLELGDGRTLFFPVLDRMLNLNAGGIRQKAYDMWQAMRQTVFSEEKLEERIEQYTMEIGESGALMRDAERWGTEMYYPDGYELINFAGIRWPLIDEVMEMLVNTDGSLDFLSASHYEQKAGDIF